MQNLGRKPKGFRQHVLKIYENGLKESFPVIIFDVYHATLKIVTYFMSHTVTGYIFVKICAHIGLFRLIQQIYDSLG